MLTTEPTETLLPFIKERHAIYTKKAAGLPKPWTDSPILQQYKFTNMYRELDYGTQWFKRGWRTKYATNKDLWFASLVYRLVNWPDTMEEIGFPVPWDPEQFIDVIQDRKRLRMKCYSGAYMISTHGVKEEKSTYLARSLSIMWERRKELRPRIGDTLHSFHERLMQCFDIGSFLAAQVVADMKYVSPLSEAADWWTFVASGPGSRRGLSRLIYGTAKPDIPWREADFVHSFHILRDEYVTDFLKENKMPKMHSQDLQNALCEFENHERVRLGEGRPKSKYPGV